MITIQEAEQIIRKHTPSPENELIRLPLALGRVLAKNVQAVEPSPRYTNSAMDGFAVRWEDIESAAPATPVILKIVGESQAGVPFQGRISMGEAARISTGGMVCAGADAVVPIEEATAENAQLKVFAAHKAHQNMRFAGEEFGSGFTLLKAGTVIQPPEMAVLAAQGIAEFAVYRKPDVSIIVTGTELVSYDAPIEAWQIRESNGLMLSAAVSRSGGNVIHEGRVGDDLDATIMAVKKASTDASIVIFSGGVSVGPHDHVKRAAAESGFNTRFWLVRQKPGKPFFFASRGGTLFFGLPGNPVSAFMCYLYYIDPLIRRLCGRDDHHHALTAYTAAPIRNRIDRAQLFRVKLKENNDERLEAHPLQKQGSHMLTSLTDADGFMLLDVGADIPAGQRVEVTRF